MNPKDINFINTYVGRIEGFAETMFDKDALKNIPKTFWENLFKNNNYSYDVYHFLVEYCSKEVCHQNKGYMQACIKNWKDNKLHTLEDIKKYLSPNGRYKIKNQNNNGSRNKSNFTERADSLSDKEKENEMNGFFG